MAQIDPKVVLEAVKTELTTVVNTLKDKGAKRFGKAIGMAVTMVFLAYAGFYAPPQKKLAVLGKNIDKARAMSEAGGRYKELRDQLTAAYSYMPQMKDRDQWLSNAMIDSLRADNLTPDNFKPVQESEQLGLIFQNEQVSLTVKFEDMYAWLIRLEGAKPLMHVQTLDVQKKVDQAGMTGVNCEVTTVIPKQRLN